MTALQAIFAAASILVGAIAVPLIRGRVKPNPWYGFRTPRTLRDETVWYPANRFGGWMLLAGAGIALLAVLLLPSGCIAARPWLPLVAYAAPMLLALILSFIHLRRL